MGELTDARLNQTVLQMLGLSAKQYANATTRGSMPWIDHGRYKPYDLDADELTCIAAWLTLTQHAKLTNNQAGAACAAFVPGLRDKPNADIWHIWYDLKKDRWAVATEAPPDPAAGSITLDLKRLRAKLAELRADAMGG